MKSRAADTRCEHCSPYGHFGHFKGANFTLKEAIIEVVVERYEPISEVFMTASALRLQNDSSHFCRGIGEISHEINYGWKVMTIDALALSGKHSGSYFRIGFLELLKERLVQWSNG
jgi:hypothetical protein